MRLLPALLLLALSALSVSAAQTAQTAHATEPPAFPLWDGSETVAE